MRRTDYFGHMKTIKWIMTTTTHQGSIYKTRTFTTKRGMGLSKERQNLEYGAHLGAEVIEVKQDGSQVKGFCLR